MNVSEQLDYMQFAIKEGYSLKRVLHGLMPLSDRGDVNDFMDKSESVAQLIIPALTSHIKNDIVHSKYPKDPCCLQIQTAEIVPINKIETILHFVIWDQNYPDGKVYRQSMSPDFSIPEEYADFPMLLSELLTNSEKLYALSYNLYFYYIVYNGVRSFIPISAYQPIYFLVSGGDYYKLT